MVSRPASLNTRERLIQAGIRLFGEQGFEATTTRGLAEAAGANIGSIAYHFANKRGLYLAAARYIAEQLRTRLALDETAAQAPVADRDAALAALRALARRMVRTFAEDEECRQWLLLVMREQVRPGEAFEILQAEAFGLVQATLGGLIARLTDRAIDDRRVILETHTLVGQIVFFLIGREPLLRRLEIEAFDETILAEIEAVIDAHLRLYAAPNADPTPTRPT
ncbi:CerR family C-terminal domain-containing protein [Halomonas saccharevitans]|uniref:CerR family C-terminal domain-containing protein n=1 Tax=Halomonas saccharevitans TaxID=416872 RepID=A0ABU3NHJ4_9GAMM|nr:CerR family C-terminal domain-containing protein [Halomonas saccharevitans]MDT8880645.1 CerR family C-terminal domain-containing protein [Halomonas saccharevitans]